MLKPVSDIAKRFGTSLPASLIAKKQERLTAVLLEPMRDITGGNVVDVFAHGNEALRVVNYSTVAGMAQHVSVDVWNVALDMWVSKRTFSTQVGPLSQPWVREHNVAAFSQESVMTVEQAAMAMVFMNSPRPAASEQLAKWGRLHWGRDGVREQLFDSKVALAEFWYETKNVVWDGGEGVGHPYLFDFMMAETIFRNECVAIPSFGEKFVENVDTAVVNAKGDWRDYGTVGELVDWIKKGYQGDDVPIVLEHFGVNYDLACDLIFSGQHEKALRELEKVMINEIKASVYFERWSEASQAAGSLDEDDKGLSVNDEVFTVDELKACARKFNISTASAQGPDQAEHIWFSSTTPDENRDYFENGISTYYALHVHTIDGREPNADDYQMIADAIGVKFSALSHDKGVDATARFG